MMGALSEMGKALARYRKARPEPDLSYLRGPESHRSHREREADEREREERRALFRRKPRKSSTPAP